MRSANNLPWYREPAIKITMFLLIFPVWVLIMVLDNQEKLYMRFAALGLGVLWFLFMLGMFLRAMSNLMS
jgi:hypothetical protein